MRVRVGVRVDVRAVERYAHLEVVVRAVTLGRDGERGALHGG